jgi:single-strand DNA-binding protein
MFQKVTIIGRLGKDPESRFTSTGKQVAVFSVATDTGYGDFKKTVWFRVAAWEKLAELCNQYLSKGKLVYVEGTLSEPRIYQNKAGENAVNLEITARDVRFLSPKGEGEPRQVESHVESKNEAIVDEEDVIF